jgi:hypothetical protein
VRGAEGPDSTGMSTDNPATCPYFLGTFAFAPLPPLGPFRRAVATLR